MWVPVPEKMGHRARGTSGTWSGSNYSRSHLRHAAAMTLGEENHRATVSLGLLLVRRGTATLTANTALLTTHPTIACACPLLAESHQTSLLLQMSQALNAFPWGFVFQFRQSETPFLS